MTRRDELLSKRARLAYNTTFVKAASVLMGGTAASQIAVIAVLPLITRIYSPAEFGEFATFTSLVGIISVIACGRLELAIPNADNPLVAAHITSAAVAILCIFTLIATAVSVLLTQISSLHLNHVGMWLLPAGIFVTGLLNICQFALIKEKRFAAISKGRLVQAVSTVTAQVLLGLLSNGAAGLMMAQLGGTVAGCVKQARGINSLTSQDVKNTTIKQIAEILKKYRDYPQFSAPEALLNTAAIHGPILIIAAMASPAEAGLVILASKIMQAPVSLIASAASHIFLAHSAEKKATNELTQFTADTVKTIATVAIGPLIFLGIVAPKVFVYAFGASWQQSGQLIGLMTPWFALQMLSSPISTIMQTAGRQAAMLRLALAGFAIRVGSVIAIPLFFADMEAAAYAASGCIFYAICLIAFSRAAYINLGHVIAIIKASAPLIALWACAGLLIASLF